MEQAPKRYSIKGTTRDYLCYTRVATVASYLLLTIGLSVLAGCAIFQKTKVEPVEVPPVVAEAPAPLPTGPTVVRFTDGREGFLITEPSSMDAQLRADFEQASVMIKATEYEKATELLEKVIAQSPGITAPYINIAIAYKHMNKPEKAEPHLKSALELFPGHPVASNEYGLLLRKAGRFAESREVYEKSLAIFPEYHPIHKNLGILCDLYLNDLACAVEHYGIYSKGVPKDEQMKLWLAGLQARLGH